MSEQQDTIQQLFSPGKGILAADESTESANDRLWAVGIDGTAENRRRYRDLFIGAPGLGQYLSGIILFDETMRQAHDDGRLFLDTLREEGVVIGIKVDGGKDPDMDSFGETTSKGLDTLPERLPRYFDMGARFAKWRSVIQIGETLPSQEHIQHEANHLAQFALMCQVNGFVPVVEPEVLLTGDHTIRQAFDVTMSTLTALFMELKRADVDMTTIVLKTSMVLPGQHHAGGKATPEEVAQATMDVLRATVPNNIGGVVFLSGGQGAVEATENLNAICQIPAPWPRTFSYARAIQGPVLARWAGKDEQKEEARAIFLERLRQNGLATQGLYKGETRHS